MIGGVKYMKKSLTSVIIIIAVITLITSVSGCSKKENAQFDVFYGETEKWLVIGRKNNNSGKINFQYGTSLGTTGSVQLLNDINYYQVKFEEDFITNLPSKAFFNENKYIYVIISYADITDSIDLSPYVEYKVN